VESLSLIGVSGIRMKPIIARNATVVNTRDWLFISGASLMYIFSPTIWIPYNSATRSAAITAISILFYFGVIYIVS